MNKMQKNEKAKKKKQRNLNKPLKNTEKQKK
jgi:hypothetical protein